MKNGILLKTLGFLMLVNGVIAQESWPIAYTVPSTLVEHLAIDDGDCPLDLKDISFVGFTKGGGSQNAYTIRNRSKQPIKSFEILELSWFGSPKLTKRTTSSEGLALMPGEEVSTLPINTRISSVAGLRDTAAFYQGLGLNPETRVLWLIMVIRVELADGTTYDARSRAESLEEFIDRLDFSERPSFKELSRKEREIRSFVEKINGRPPVKR